MARLTRQWVFFVAACGGSANAPEATDGEDGATPGATAGDDDGDTTGGDGSGSSDDGSGSSETGDPVVLPGEPVVPVWFESAVGVAEGEPVTFAQAFAAGDVPDPLTVTAQLPGSDDALPAQARVAATHADGSVRHAIITVASPALSAGQAQEIVIATADPVDREPLGLEDLLGSSFDASVELDLGGSVYRADVRSALEAEEPATWLEGPLATEWTVAAPFVTDGGDAHPHLVARFDVRAFAGEDRARVDVVVENNWAFVDGPSNLRYDATIRVGGELVASYPDLTHFAHARWRETVWWGEPVDVHVRHDLPYLVTSGAVPAYDPALVVGEDILARMEGDWAEASTEPMGLGFTSPGMPAGGARPDIGALPRWGARYLLSMDPRAKAATLGTGDLAGSWSIHYRDRDTDLPVSIETHPDIGLLAADDAFPTCSDCDTPYNPDSAHQPSLAYLPYLVTGDRYYLEELLFWANWNILRANPNSRGYEQGLVQWEQVRGQAWSLRTLAHAAYITPDAHPMRDYFEARVAANLAWYEATYLEDAGAPSLGFLEARTYDGLGIVPWMDDFFTHTLAWMVAMGFEDAVPMLDFKAQFPVGRMVDPGFCWVLASETALVVRDSEASPYYDSFAEVYAASIDPAITGLTCGSPEMAGAAGVPEGAMVGYPFSPTGYPSNLRPALAAAVDAGAENSEDAWELFISRPVKPTDEDYAADPNYAIVPRKEYR